MRVICTIPNHEEASHFSTFLNQKGIPNQCEEVPLHGKESLYRIWVINEDQIGEAQELFQEFRQNPVSYSEVVHPEIVDESPQPRQRQGLSPAPYGIISKGIIVTTILLFLWSAFHQGITMPPHIPGIVPAPVLKNVVQELSYDYPAYFEKRDELLTLYPPEAIRKKELPSPQAEAWMKKIQATPFWNGTYDRVVAHIKDQKSPIRYEGPLFEKISQGEVWRVFTPALLHYDLLHIFFNLLWFILLGNQIEYRIGKLRYLILILLAALASNLSQYLMSGSFFMGLSGVVVALAAFIWARSQVAPWEGYLLQKTTLSFLAIFILGIFALQVVFFFLQIFTTVNLNVQIANTAHLVGGAVGYLLGRMHTFSIQKQKSV
jgi:GlpG protein